ncbi:MAG: hypothetical protein PHN22_02295, partial [Candidatus ainarchaeum sp.]|nr:hypothetical protein [Candidatus ainarchaeum sp.]
YDARDACESIGGHVMTNEEHMTILRNLERVSENWSGGEIGSGYLPRGNSSSSDAMNSTDELSGVTKRTLKLTNNEYIWDLSGNVWEWVDKTLDASEEPYGETLPSSTGEWIEYFTGVDGYKSLTNLNSLDYKDIFLINKTYNTTQSIGRLNTDAGDSGDRAFFVGGYWHDGSHAGVLSRLLNLGPSTRSSSIGFRCVVVP